MRAMWGGARPAPSGEPPLQAHSPGDITPLPACGAAFISSHHTIIPTVYGGRAHTRTARSTHSNTPPQTLPAGLSTRWRGSRPASGPRAAFSRCSCNGGVDEGRGGGPGRHPRPPAVAAKGLWHGPSLPSRTPGQGRRGAKRLGAVAYSAPEVRGAQGRQAEPGRRRASRKARSARRARAASGKRGQRQRPERQAGGGGRCARGPAASTTAAARVLGRAGAPRPGGSLHWCGRLVNMTAYR